MNPHGRTPAQREHDSPASPVSDSRTVLHWYDFLCPFCYVGQTRTAVLRRHGLDVVELPFQAHPDIPPGGIPAGARGGPMYDRIEQEARDAGLTLHWPRRLPNTARALASAEWVRRHEPRAFLRLHERLFAAHFALGEDLEDDMVIDRHAREAGVDLDAMHAALADGSAAASVAEAARLGRTWGVHGTPAWLIAWRLVTGLQPTADFERMAEYAARLPR